MAPDRGVDGRGSRIPAGRASAAALACRRAVRVALGDLPAGALVLVACSGGADSLALAAATAWVAPRHGLRAGAVVVDHGLQARSPAVAEAAAAACRGLGLDPVEVVAVSVRTGPGSGGPEAAARAARHDALLAAAESSGAAAVLLGHTRDDQAETVLLRLARGSGARALAGMAPVAGVLRRPLLGLPRPVVRASLEGSGLVPWEDPHNEDPAFGRTRVRRDLLPALAAALGPGAAPALARTADLLRADADALDAWAATALAAATVPAGEPAPPAAAGGGSAGPVGTAGEPGGVVLDVATLAGLPVAVRTRVLRRAALDAGAPAGDLSYEHVAAVDRLVAAWHGQGPVRLPGRVRAERRCGRLHLHATP